MTQLKNNLTGFGKPVSFTINNRGGVDFLGECDISEEELLGTKAYKQTKYEIAKGIITSMMTAGDRTSNDIYDACLEAGVSGVMQRVKKKLCIKSEYKDDDWYWTLPRGEDGVDHAKGRDNSNTTEYNDDYNRLRGDDHDDETPDYKLNS